MTVGHSGKCSVSESDPPEPQQCLPGAFTQAGRKHALQKPRSRMFTAASFAATRRRAPLSASPEGPERRSNSCPAPSPTGLSRTSHHDKLQAYLPKAGIWQRRAAAAKSLQSCPTLCDPIDGSPPGSPVPGILQARTLEWSPFPSPMRESEVAQSCPTLCNPMDYM